MPTVGWGWVVNLDSRTHRKARAEKGPETKRERARPLQILNSETKETTLKFKPGERAARLAAARDRRALARAERRAAAAGRRPKKKTERERALERIAAERLLRRPEWADRDGIKALRIRAFESGRVVDHIIPLRGQTVSGLDILDNMQLLTWDENQEKGRRFNASDFDYQRDPNRS